ncbi:MAG: tetratricopeptide repeat protein, partial [Desulfobacterales bacterium]
HPKTASALNALAVVYLRMAKFNEATPLIERAIKIRSSALGPDHPDIIPLLENLLSLYEQEGNYQKSNEVAERIKSIQNRQQ